jgi:hypothetical protein
MLGGGHKERLRHGYRRWMMFSYSTLVDSACLYIHQAHEILDRLNVREPFRAAFADHGARWRLNLLRNKRSGS